MVKAIHIDVESYSEVDLLACGTHVYAEHPSTRIHVICWAMDDGPVNTWVPYSDVPVPIVEAMVKFHAIRGMGTFLASKNPPLELFQHASEGGQFRAYSAQFETTVLNGPPGQKIGFPPTQNAQWTCVMAKTCAHALPAALEYAGEVLEAPHKKNKAGYHSMMKLAKPRTNGEFRKGEDQLPVTHWSYEAAMTEYIELFQYCVDDVETERCIDDLLPDLPPAEQRLWQFDRKVNQRGIAIDRKALADVQYLVNEYKAILKKKCLEICDIEPSQVAKLGEWIREHGFPIENLQAPTIRDALARDDLPADVRKVLHIRSLYGMAAVAKYEALKRATGSDGRLRGMFVYHKAATGRWSSQIVQLQNLYRGKHSDMETLVAAFAYRDLRWLRTLYETNPMVLFATGVRGMFIAGKGKQLAAMDFGQVEARCVAWMAGQRDKLKIFETHGMVYEYTGAKIHRLPLEIKALKLMKMYHQQARFDGKVTELACGYQGGKNAVVKMARQQGTDMDVDFAEDLKNEWREANPKIVGMWQKLTDYAKAAVADPGKNYSTNKVTFRVQGDFLYMRLPSGRKLAYYKPELRDSKFGEQLTYLGVDTDTRQWKRIATYGGRLTQNAAEGICRDLLARAMMRLEAAGYPVIMHVHDEVVTEIDQDKGSLEEMREIMCDLPDWAEGFPIHAAGFMAKRYRKE